jgi:hypothetical protein
MVSFQKRDFHLETITFFVFLKILKNIFGHLFRMEKNGNKRNEKMLTKFTCDTCDVICFKKSEWSRHLSTLKHQKLVFGNKKNELSNTVFNCEKCDFVCSYKSDWQRHIETEKHLEIGDEKSDAKPLCCCGKSFKTISGLWKHKKKCISKKQGINMNENNDTELIWNLVKQNQEFKEMLVEQQKYMTELAQKTNIVNNNTINNNNNNTQNNQFNLQFFLNETCKNAMNINQFIDSIQIKLEDLEYTGKNGYVQGISNVIVRELKSLDQKDRPLHCSDEKREVIYIKTNDIWEKDINHAGVTRFTKHLTHKKFLKINEWIAKYPTCLARDDKRNDEYLNILGQIVSGLNQLNDTEKPESLKKIIRTVAKQVAIQKNDALAL